MNSLSKGPPLIELNEFMNGGDNHTKEFEQAQQPQKAQHTQVHVNECGEIEGQNRRQIDDGIEAENIFEARIIALGKFRILRSYIKSEQIFS